ncbi:MAG: OmpA family protein, partial [Bacteroidales bacterium]|nr:OmpA family protein [Bacteroidales bacterium]
AIGAVVGATAGSIIGDRMDAKAKELASIEGAAIDTVYDANNLKAIKVTFDNGILFKTSSSELSDVSKASLKDFADKMKDFEQTDILVQGHTDHTGTREYNEKLSVDRANSVARYLNNCGMGKDRFTVEGLAWDKMVVDTEKACQENRRVEVYITANEDMIKKAEKEAKNAQ